MRSGLDLVVWVYQWHRSVINSPITFIQPRCWHLDRCFTSSSMATRSSTEQRTAFCVIRLSRTHETRKHNVQVSTQTSWTKQSDMGTGRLRHTGKLTHRLLVPVGHYLSAGTLMTTQTHLKRPTESSWFLLLHVPFKTLMGLPDYHLLHSRCCAHRDNPPPPNPTPLQPSPQWVWSLIFLLWF